MIISREKLGRNFFTIRKKNDDQFLDKLIERYSLDQKPGCDRSVDRSNSFISFVITQQPSTINLQPTAPSPQLLSFGFQTQPLPLSARRSASNGQRSPPTAQHAKLIAQYVRLNV